MSFKFGSDKIYATYEFEDETSSTDPLGHWVGGCEYHVRTYRCRIPIKMLERDDEAEISNYIDSHQHIKEFWV